MQDDCIVVALELPQLKILDQRELKDQFEVTVIYRREAAICPRCGQLTKKEHDRRAQWKQDRKLRDKMVFLKLIKRRFRCLWCNKVFTEPDEVFGKRRRSSQRLRDYLGQAALHQTVRRTAQEEEVGEGLVRRCVAEGIGRSLEAKGVTVTPEFIGLDEFSVSRPRLFHTSICNLDKGEVMEVVEGQGREKVEDYLSKLPNQDKVKAVAMDMHEPFRQAVEMTLPGAKIVVDKFHLIKHVNYVLDKIRVRLQGNGKKDKRLLFESRYKLLKGAEKLTGEEREKLKEIFQSYPSLQEAWLLKEKFRAWYKGTDMKEAEYKLNQFEMKIENDRLPEFKELDSILTNWRKEILNYFEFRITNGFVEGKNNRIKVIKRMAYGYRNMANFRLRILATNFKDERPSVSHLLT